MVTHVDKHIFSNALERIREFSPFLSGLSGRFPAIVAAVRDEGLDRAIRDGLAAEQSDDIGKMLRRQRQIVSLATALADLTGIATLEEVVAHLSAFADHALDTAVRAAIVERTPDAAPRGFAALALGKHGSRELNYSSDIDPILIFDPATLPHRPREEPVEAAVRIARRVVELLQSRDEHGYVFRVDLRLRPSPEVSPLALPIDAALSYYESAALPWERAAFIRARAAAGDTALGQDFLDAIRPFVWRRSVDFGAVREIRQISRRIRDHYSQGQVLGPGYDLKRGRGGIREVEFFTQIHQLIHGGREPQLRAPATLDALRALSEAGRIEPAVAADLAEAYRLYRTVEHRLQMVDDQQTHRLPKQIEALDNVARLHGLDDGRALVELLRPHVDRVGSVYDGLDNDGEARLPVQPDQLETALQQAGFADPRAARLRIEVMRDGKSRSLRTPVAQEALEAMLPTLIAALGKAPEPQDALNRFEDLVAGLPSAINLFRLLQARPALARALIDVLSHAPTLSQALGRRPALLDGLIDATALAAPPAQEELIVEFRDGERSDSYEQLLDSVRQRVGERRFALGVQLIEAVSDPLDVAQGYARVAEAALAVLTDATVAEFEENHGRVPGGELLIVALGRLGGGALTHASDLDIVYLFSGGFMAESDGPRPLGATTYFNRLAQRVSAAMSVPTAAGPLYEVDTRLRPSGTQGPLAVSVEGFAQYQRESAWTWEHMALTRARTIFGSPPARAEVDAIIAEALGRERDPTVLLADVVKMRSEVARHKPPSSPFDVKLIDGGLVDAEFTVHLLQLRHRVGFDPRLRTAMRLLVDQGLLDPALIPAHELLTRMLVTLRLVSPASTAPPEASRALVARTCGQEDWPSLVKAYETARGLIGGEWRRVSSAG
ncbi:MULTISPECIES: bifunctional [glutamine synthetase] adenylyltransferase/[glutamine synthetase]-adenylyl-L-tyrosine phosphorylase [unclassified Sphingomonas]|uniref:bifunctional [glutamine synthetase] adenylyltransferase/[glutamine synthetase]-adenylyl-L-tyrosine phosphorylase n=1 Tax=unclassified Sphingomonas TaxID=196159 RepID=UPI000701D972|nr:MULTISPECIES: bifunctional [glutamine synthetase] adenylyltransferase/[glutamine synthetase]-adenylyl-L-tyrosine phosphorylase [unclassified Sphingomonas]KQX17808.1 glutamate-ammonia-ligase adenylyltransferase [Sphingomonas sp. Root1294]KQY70734.1 glutamate-ammonia-ligase adenylyltransferase [Sphingomonas sp. Root50]KRB91773.1 glutamate-ammonia-ligase adenylyltransferase [Sphingomonas sp. Root720]